MSADAEPTRAACRPSWTVTAPGSPGAAGAGAATGGGPAAGASGRLLGRLSVLPVLLAMAWLLAGLPLLLAGRFMPVLMLVVSVPLAALLVYLGLRWIPGRWQSALPQAPQQARTPWWARRRGDRGGGRVRRPSADLSLPADHRGARPSVLYAVRVLDRPPRLAADPAGAGGVRRQPPAAPLRQPRLLPGRRERGAAVHGGPADGPGGRVLGRRGGRGGRRAAAARGLRGAHLRRPRRPADRAAVGAAGGPRPRALPARAVHQPVDLQRAAGADPVPRRAVPGHRLAGGRRQGGPGAGGARRPGARPHPGGAHRRGERHPAGDPVLRDPAPVPAAAGGPAAHRPAGRRALRRRGRAGPVPAVPGDDQQLTEPAGGGRRGGRGRDGGRGGGALAAAACRRSARTGCRTRPPRWRS